MRALADDRGILFFAVIVGSDGPGADVDLFPDGRVSHVREMRHFCSIFYGCFFQLDKISYFNIFPYGVVRSYVSEGAYLGLVVDG